ncbi:hypothetical protein J3459_006156 [Metarhizium acridum]|uniref:uncharacterized protein n=1 Tax=Metarhizium acridum TaxID=92637 RepID=UPI001C6C87BA|nr:hypothetical protein J3458_005410 [Metarhizium acridum]KAG8428027.1 hypothetical protein J3459_006156 [Metarhizium acridum]
MSAIRFQPHMNRQGVVEDCEDMASPPQNLKTEECVHVVDNLNGSRSKLGAATTYVWYLSVMFLASGLRGQGMNRSRLPLKSAAKVHHGSDVDPHVNSSSSYH